MSRVDVLCDRADYWCGDVGNLGYDQGNRWDIREGGECDCSSLGLWVAYEAGYLPEPPTWGNSETIADQLAQVGWVRVPNDGNPQRGYILVNHKNHVAIWTGDHICQASRDERGRYFGGESGDQDGGETNTCGYYDYPWDYYLAPPEDGDKMIEGQDICTYDWHAGDNQLFRIEPDGGYWRIVARNGKVLDCSGAGTEDGTPVILWEPNGGDHQLWRVMENTAGDYSIAPKHAPDMRLEQEGCGYEMGKPVELWTDNGGANQRWLLHDVDGDGWCALVNALSLRVADVYGGL